MLGVGLRGLQVESNADGAERCNMSKVYIRLGDLAERCGFCCFFFFIFKLRILLEIAHTQLIAFRALVNDVPKDPSIFIPYIVISVRWQCYQAH